MLKLKPVDDFRSHRRKPVAGDLGMTRAKVAFDDADSNGDGQLNRAEFATYLAQSPRPLPPIQPVRSSIHPMSGAPRGSVQAPDGSARQAVLNSRKAKLKIESMA